MCSEDVVGFVVRKCPFLHELAGRHGEQFARDIAVSPAKQGDVRRPLLEELDDLQHSFTLFHGPLGAVPLASKARPTELERDGVRCPFSSNRDAKATSGSFGSGAGVPSSALPLASMSLSFGGVSLAAFLILCLICQRIQGLQCRLLAKLGSPPSLKRWPTF